MSEDVEEVVTFKPNTELSSRKTTYLIEKTLGEGGFGAVFRVKDTKSGQVYAMKVERKRKGKDSKLKMEIFILKLVGNERKNSHFANIVDKGKHDKQGFFYLIMELTGLSLGDLKKRSEKKHFSISTGLSACQQCLEACEDLHKYGFIHRDIKPANYAVGYKNPHVIYILDFGISRKILNERGELKTPRVTVAFKGTGKFASLSCHRNKEMGWKDDCESWFYMLLDLTVATGLPWAGVKQLEQVQQMKEESRENKEKLYGELKCAGELAKILAYVDSLQYQDRLDYQFIYKMLEEAGSVSGAKMDAPYDWE